MYWWNIPTKLSKSFVKSKRSVEAQDVFATFHYCIASHIEVGNVRIPQVFCFGNSLWLTLEYYSGNLMNNKLSTTNRRMLIEGELHKSIVSKQLAGKIFLRRSGGVLCGPDEYFNCIIYSLGPEFYWGTMIPEMNLCIASGMSFTKIMKHDFNKCFLMKGVRIKDKLSYNKRRVFKNFAPLRKRRLVKKK